MGSLEGHLLPGSFMLGFGLWWTYALFDRYFKCLVHSVVTKKVVSFRSSASFSPIEGFVKIFASFVGMIAEYMTALDQSHHFSHIGNSQHITMYLFFLINGVVDLAIYYGYPVPRDSDYMTLILAVGVEGLLFCFHLHGRTQLDIHVHTLLIVAVLVSVVVGLAECRHRNNVLFLYLRTLCALLQGSWFCTVGFILYPPFSEGAIESSHDNIMLLTTLFCWQIAALILLMTLTGICFYFKYRNIITNIEFSTDNHWSDTDCKTLIKVNTNNDTNENQFKDSVNECKYSVISTSDEEI